MFINKTLLSMRQPNDFDIEGNYDLYFCFVLLSCTISMPKMFIEATSNNSSWRVSVLGVRRDKAFQLNNPRIRLNLITVTVVFVCCIVFPSRTT